MNDTLPSLDALGITFGTDKSSVVHNYLNFYERYFQPLRLREITLLEIGLLGGASLAVWEAYFPNATIIGADIDRRTLRFARPRVAVEIIDQANVEHLTRLAIQHGPFDIVIEDGSHMWEHQITSLRTLFPFVKNGGFYVVEDLQTNFPSMAAEYRGTASISCVEYLKKLVDLRVADGKIDITREEDAFLRTYGRAMASMNFSRHVCLLEKFYTDGTNPAAGEPFATVDPDVPVVLRAHLGGEGDRTSQAGWVRVARSAQGIQGFSLNAGDGQACPLLYRARSAGGRWSDWATGGAYVGTKGLADNLTGFAVKLTEAGEKRFKLEVFCQFAGSGEVVSRTGGGEFVSPSGRHFLSGLQVVLRARRKPA